MGKFSKALKKEEKKHTDKPVTRANQDYTRLNRKPSSKSTLSSAEMTGKQRGSDMQHQVHMVSDHSNKKPVSDPLESASVAPSASTVVEEPIAAKPDPKPSPHLLSQDARPSVETPQPSVESQIPAPTAVHYQAYADNPSPLVQDPSKGTPSQQISAQEPALHRSNPSTSPADVPPSNKKVKVSYSKTKVQVMAPELLKNNRVFSVFDDFEITDQIKILRTQVLRKLKAIGGNSILITSANPYEGKTFTSINLGISIAKEFDRTVLIIDADIRKPTKQHSSFSTNFFSLKVEHGLTDYLEGNVDISDILINPGIDKLTLIPGGVVPVDNSPELLNSGRMELMMQEIKSRYPADRVVIVDGPALLPYPDAMILVRYVDGVIPVIESERTPVDEIKKMMLRLKEVNILGTVLNKNKANRRKKYS